MKLWYDVLSVVTCIIAGLSLAIFIIALFVDNILVEISMILLSILCCYTAVIIEDVIEIKYNSKKGVKKYVNNK